MTFLLAHLSDLHLGPLLQPRLRELAGKRLTGFWNWTRNRGGSHDMDALARIVADMLAQKPDHIAVTGDLVNIALPGEFTLARRFMEELGAPDRVSFVPGNHDAYVRSAVPLAARTFAPWTTDDDSGQSVFPYLRRRAGVALIGVSSAVPTAPLLASGRVGSAQRARLAERLDAAKAEGLARVVMVHHPPHRAGASRARGLSDAAQFESLLLQHGAELVIHGHNHRPSVAHLGAAGTGDVPVVGVPSASANGAHNHRAAYNLYAIETGANRSVTGRARGLLDDRLAVGDLGPLSI